jgi:pilus assembly protein CpaE
VEEQKQKISFYLADDKEESFKFLKELIEGETGWVLTGSASTYDDFISGVLGCEPNVILVSIAFLVLLDTKEREQLIGTLPSAVILAISDSESLPELRAALRLGAKDLLACSKGQKEVREVIRRHVELERERLHYLVKQGRFFSQDDFQSDFLKEQNRPGELIAICSGKGGVGKSFLSCHLAGVLGRFSAAKLVLVDLNLSFADLTTLLNIPSDDSLKTISDLLVVIDEIDSQVLGNVLYKHPEGFDVLLAAGDFEESRKLTGEHIEAILESLQNQFDLVLVDAGTPLSDVSLTALEKATAILLLTTMDVPSLQNNLHLLKILKRKAISEEKVKVVVNRIDSRFALDVSQVEEILSLPILGEIVEDEGALNLFEREGNLLLDRLDLAIMNGVAEVACQMFPFDLPKKKRRFPFF